jgi:NodT family efflux transporter outer membrane factor (OMF) lipoprotein
LTIYIDHLVHGGSYAQLPPDLPHMSLNCARYRVGLSSSVIFLLAIFALYGCMSLPEQSPTPLSFEVPAAWSITPTATLGGITSLVQWWQRFDDPLLDTLVARAMENNTNVNTAQASLRQAWALRDVAAAALWPSLGVSASAQHGTSGGKSVGNTFQAGLNMNWVPDIFGANRNALNAADATAQSSDASLGDVQVAIAAEVGLSYITLRNAQTRLAIASQNLTSQEETLQITQWRQQAGLVTELETEQARALAEQTRATLPTLQTAIEQTRHALAVLTGQPPAALMELLAATKPIPQAAADLSLNIPAEALRQRADVRAAELKATAALARVAQAEAVRLPSFVLGGSLSLNALTLGTLTNSASVMSSVIASMAAPIFDGGALRAQVRSQQAAFDQARLAYEAAVLGALKDVEDVLIALQGDRQRLLSLRNAADAAATASLLARQRYSSGLVDFQVVLETQRTQLNTQDGVASADAEVSADQVRLYKALGGGWHPGAASIPDAMAKRSSIP